MAELFITLEFSVGLDDTLEVFEHAKTASTKEAATTTLLKKVDVDIRMFFFPKQTGKRKVQLLRYR